MALIKCTECGKDVSTEAKKCPSCGAKVKLPKKPTSPFLKYLLIGVFGVSVIGAFIGNQDNRDAKKADDDKLAAMSPEQRSAALAQRQAAAASAAAIANAKKAAQEKAAAESEALRHDIGMAEVTCSMLFEKRAHDPSSVEWIRDERKFNFTSKDMKHATSVQGVRAKNAMGGLIKGVVKCALVKDATGWNVVKMEQL